jgi:multiple sugar transport system ATP-binding protein
MTMADRVAVLRRGKLQQVGAAQVLYERPTNLFVADFIGSPSMNLVAGHLDLTEAGVPTLALAHGGGIELPAAVLERASFATGRAVIMGIRPEATLLHAPDAPGLAATVRLVELLGGETLVHVEVDAPPVVTDELVELASDLDDADVPPEFGPKARFVAKVQGTSPLRSGERVVVAPAATARIHLFDPATSEALP